MSCSHPSEPPRNPARGGSDTHHISITLTYGDLSVHAGAHVDRYSGEMYTDMGNRATAVLANAYEVLTMTVHRLSAENTGAGQA